MARVPDQHPLAAVARLVGAIDYVEAVAGGADHVAGAAREAGIGELLPQFIVILYFHVGDYAVQVQLTG